MNVSITLVPRGGLANRMRAIASAVSLSTRIGADLTVVWINTSDLSAAFSDLFLADRLPFELKDLPCRKFIYLPQRAKYLYLPSIWQDLTYTRVLRDERKRDRHYLIDSSPKTVYAFFRSIRAGSVLVDTCHEFYPYSPDLYRSLFCPSSQVGERISFLIPDHLNSRPVGLHVRRTDHIQAIQNSPLSLFEKAINDILATDPAHKFYLATDDNDTKAHLCGLFPGHILTSPDTASRSSLQGMIDGAAEMFALSKCSHIIGSFNSSYSEAAALIGDIPIRIIKN